MEKTVLTVDDSNAVRLTIALTLKQGGYRVLQAASGFEALELIKSEHVDLVISDFNMPGMDGIQLTRNITALKPEISVPVIILTTEHQKGMLSEAKEAGAIGWMYKPFKSEDLLAACGKIFERYAAKAKTSPA